ncbi:thiamine-phosphate kinase [soil metagenome]
MSAGNHVAMGGGAEFDLIRRLLDTWGPRASGIGDDAAVIDVPHGERLVASTDASVENVHFRREWMSPREVGARAATAALSDLAAMGARPLGLLLALALPERWERDAEAIADGVGVTASRVACPIVGGNVTRGEELTLTVTVLGCATRPITRAGAREGNIIFVTGRLGGPGSALASLLAGAVPQADALARFIAPSARIDEGRWLAERGATAMIDISDGLIADANHLANASGVSLSLDETSVPCLGGVEPNAALVSGEEYELLVAIPSDIAIDTAAFQQEFGIALTRIGVSVPRGNSAVLARTSRDVAGGHDHLANR